MKLVSICMYQEKDVILPEIYFHFLVLTKLDLYIFKDKSGELELSS